MVVKTTTTMVQPSAHKNKNKRSPANQGKSNKTTPPANVSLPHSNRGSESLSSVRHGSVAGSSFGSSTGPVTHIHFNNGTPMEGESTGMTDESTTGGLSAPTNSFLRKSRVASSERISVDAAVTQIIFPNMRFITGGKDDPILDYSEAPRTLCNLILQECNITSNKERFWKNARHWIASKLVSLRNDRTQYIQKAFFGKFELH